MKHFIKNIEITNFKSIRHAEVKDCRRVNVLVGYPNVGKSNILEALATLSYNQKFEASFSEIVRLEGYSEIFYNGNVEKNSVVKINDGSLIINFVYKNEKSITCILNQKVGLPNNKTVEDKKEIGFLENTIESISNYKFYANQEDKIKKYSFKNVYNTTKTNGKTLVSPNGANLFDVIELNKETKSQVKELFDVLNLKLAFDKNDNHIKLIKALEDGTFYLIPFHQIADTLQRLIFYKAAIISNTGTVLLLEEPESHMFPPYISKMTGDIIYDENGNQFFIATHSPYVLGDLIRDVEPDELSVYIVDYDAVKGETIIHRMNEEEVNEAYQFGHDFFMNINQFIPNTPHEQV